MLKNCREKVSISQLSLLYAKSQAQSWHVHFGFAHLGHLPNFVFALFFKAELSSFFFFSFLLLFYKEFRIAGLLETNDIWCNGVMVWYGVVFLPIIRPLQEELG